MTSLGLVERKQISNKVIASEKYIDPDNDATFNNSVVLEPNPNVSILHIFQALGKIYANIQENYKFILNEKQRRLEIGCVVKRNNNFLHLNWIFFDRKNQGAKKIYANIDQQVFPFFPFDTERNPVEIILRTPRNDPVIDELVDLAARANVTIVPLVPLSSSLDFKSQVDVSNADSASGADSIERTLAEQKAKDEDDASAAALRKQIEEEAIAASKPLQFVAPGPFDPQRFLDSGAICLGDVNEDDLSRSIDIGGDDESVSRAIEIPEPIPVEPTEEELNAEGAAIYKKDEIHRQIILALNHVTTFFPPYVTITSSSGFDGKASTNSQQTVYVATDVQEIYETQYSKIKPLKQMVVKFFPLIHLSETEKRFQNVQLWIRNKYTGEDILLSSADQFSILFDFAQKSYGTFIHKVAVVSNEVGRTKNAISYIQSMFWEDLEKVVLKPFELSKRYADEAKREQQQASEVVQVVEAPVVAPTATVASVKVVPVVIPAPVPAQPTIQPIRIVHPISSMSVNLRRHVPSQAARVNMNRPYVKTNRDNNSLF